MSEIELSSGQPIGALSAPRRAAIRRRCPYCRSVEISRSHRRGPIEKYLLRAIDVRVYRCDDCNSRFYGFAHSDPAVSPRNQAA
jgi:DNA-directed RNA polymerase subunit RPC12/RpoP